MKETDTNPIHVSKPIKDGSIWRILRYDGVKVGAYATKELAQRAIDRSAWL